MLFRSSTLGYNTDDSLAWEKDPALNQRTYGYTSTATTITDANGRAAVYSYDTSGRVNQVKDALLFHEDYGYDSANNKTQVTDKRGNAWTYTFDGMGNVLTAKDPLLHTTTNTYNSHNKPLHPCGRARHDAGPDGQRAERDGRAAVRRVRAAGLAVRFDADAVRVRGRESVPDGRGHGPSAAGAPLL